MKSFRVKPSLSASRRSMRTQAEWKVLAQMSFARSPSIRSRRDFSSSAALFVKVMAMMRQAPRAHMRRGASPPPKPGLKHRKPASVALSGTSSVSGKRPYLRAGWRSVYEHRGLAAPGPSRTSRGPSVASTASLCIELSCAKSASIIRLRAAI